MERSRLARAATIIMLGNLATSALGFVRQLVIAAFFGKSQTDAWFAAYTIPQMFYDLVVGGAVAAALIPSFTRLAESNRQDFWRVVTTIFVLAAAALVLVIGILEVLANPLMTLIANGFSGGAGQSRLPLSIKLVRAILPTLFFWGMSAVALAALYSLGKRVAASFSTACFHLGIIAAAVILARPLGVIALPIGAIAGSAAQFLVQTPSLFRSRREIGASLGRRINFRDPVVRKILFLYGPVALGIVVSIGGQVADVWFKSHLNGVGRFSAMQFATTLIQFPVGIIVAALGLAVLPMISSDAAAQRLEDFKQKLGLGFRLVLIVMVPAALGLILLGEPLARLLFQHGHLSHSGTIQIATALLGYGPQLPFIGLDQLLIFAFYARHDTVTPMLAGVLGVGIYVVSAAFLLQYQVLGLAVANTLQISAHAILLLILLVRTVGPIAAKETSMTLGKVTVATGGMSAAILLSRWGTTVASLGRYASLWKVVVPMVAAILVYALLLSVLRLEEVRVMREAVVMRLWGSSSV